MMNIMKSTWWVTSHLGLWN